MNNYEDIIPKFPNLTKSEINLWDALSTIIEQHKDGWILITNSDLADIIHTSVRTIVRGLRKLEVEGYIKTRYNGSIREIRRCEDG
jgi:DNA-binding MurR/RpiR family transcriptional regulator